MALSNYLLRAASRIVPLAAVFARRPRYNHLSSVNRCSLRLRSSIAAPRYFSYLPTADETKESDAVKDESKESEVADKDEEESVPGSGEALIKSLNVEILFEESEENSMRIEELPSNFPFEFEDNPGQQTVILTKVYQGEITIVQVPIPTPTPVIGENGEASPSQQLQLQLPIVVRVSKSHGPYLEFCCTTEVDKISIDSLAFKDSNGAKDGPYEGPEFRELGEDVQKGFYKYLENRGVKPSTTNYLHQYMLNKDCREYYMWLKNVKSFVDN